MPFGVLSFAVHPVRLCSFSVIRFELVVCCSDAPWFSSSILCTSSIVFYRERERGTKKKTPSLDGIILYSAFFQYRSDRLLFIYCCWQFMSFALCNNSNKMVSIIIMPHAIIVLLLNQRYWSHFKMLKWKIQRTNGLFAFIFFIEIRYPLRIVTFDKWNIEKWLPIALVCDFPSEMGFILMRQQNNKHWKPFSRCIARLFRYPFQTADKKWSLNWKEAPKIV